MNPEIKGFLEKQGVKLDRTQETKLADYRKMIIDVSARMNLVSSGDLDRLEELHFTDSLAPAGIIPYSSRIADWGSGAGLPGIPLAIARPDLKITLVESKRKKASFLIRIKRELEIENIRVFPDRGESITDNFQVITVRAIGRITDVMPGITEHLADHGGILFYKGPGADDELTEVSAIIQGFKLKRRDLRLPSGERRSYLYIFR
ncbi:16S rRNA (guanine(527)-N(7))-methyltransferase RsmG [candidate division WOR-3 bacterium]|uniref:Ribosomal RNA small subunit methyltransferase G n=1 Tax=candidate division WOR-3 bacterium TaxID=2052148 RepID=A0A9D5KAY5_UNCW3|nr:16S rRNA (guanine(527)-N(7))-methyltransferase RsmG [candidate division WOR-3 bacterium]MBD3364416.1 16S rRNA (guanine(527)-N(7))-methyltransferase RsmG [candidate division WOR-3 bacterium]